MLYKSKLDFFQTEEVIKLVKDTFERELAEQLSLQRVTAPRFLITGTGLQDDLAGTQQAVSFNVRFTDKPIEIVHSLAKWKRQTLGKHEFKEKTGLYADMDAVRKDEGVDDIHSIYVDQWDWEQVIPETCITLDYLKYIVNNIYAAILTTESVVAEKYPVLKKHLADEIIFIHSEDLERSYPKLSPKEREYEITKKHGAVFLIGIGYPLPISGEPHDLRAVDYDDWITPTSKTTRGLNGDILVWNSVRRDSLELSSMGIRVSYSALHEQMKITGKTSWYPYHQKIKEGNVPYSVGGGIGQSRLCMLLLQKIHIGEVQSSAWPKEERKKCKERGISLL